MSFGLNRAEVIGRLGADVTINHLASGGRVANMSIATDESYIDRSMVASCRQSRPRIRSSYSTVTSAARQRSASSFCSTNARNEQKTWPRIAASQELWIGRVRSCTFARLNRSSIRSNSLYRSTSLSGVIVALIRSAKMPSKRASHKNRLHSTCRRPESSTGASGGRCRVLS